MTENQPANHRYSIPLPRPFWIGLAAAVLLVAAVALRIGAPIYQEQAAIREIERLGGTVFVEKGGPVWLRNRLGDERMTWFEHVNSVQLYGIRATDGACVHLARFSHLQHLALDGAEITDGGLVSLAGLTNLTTLSLGNTRITDSGLVRLLGLTNLVWLSLNHTQISDAGLDQLHDLKNLSRLQIRGTKASPKGIGRLEKALPQLDIHY